MTALRRVTAWLILAGVGVTGAGAGDKDRKESQEKKVTYEADFTGYFVKNDAPLKDNPAYLVLTDKQQFDHVFGIARTLKKPRLIDARAFDKKLAVAAIKRGNSVWAYKVDKVTAADGELRVSYLASGGDPTAAQFASPLIVLVDRHDYARVVFVENGKEVARANVKK